MNTDTARATALLGHAARSQHEPACPRIKGCTCHVDKSLAALAILDGTAGDLRVKDAAPALLAALRRLVDRADTTMLADGSSLDTLEAHAALQLATGEPWLTDQEPT